MLGWSFSMTFLGKAIEEVCLKADMFVEVQRLAFKHSFLQPVSYSDH